MYNKSKQKTYFPTFQRHYALHQLHVLSAATGSITVTAATGSITTSFVLVIAVSSKFKTF